MSGSWTGNGDHWDPGGGRDPKILQHQRKGYLPSMKSDLRNLATAQEAYLYDNQTYYAGAVPSGLLTYDPSVGVSISRRVHHTAERDARRLGGGHKPHRDRKNMRHIPRHGPRDGTCGYRGGSEVLVNVRGWSMLPR